jgi:hypothetical protein
VQPAAQYELMELTPEMVIVFAATLTVPPFATHGPELLDDS